MESGVDPRLYDGAIAANRARMIDRALDSLLDCVLALEKRVIDLEAEVEKLKYE